tara:strand:+ start:69327 stop:70346 length:1020 start_codon:yes stop_codon:yes gene_type:complete
MEKLENIGETNGDSYLYYMLGVICARMEVGGSQLRLPPTGVNYFSGAGLSRLVQLGLTCEEGKVFGTLDEKKFVFKSLGLSSKAKTLKPDMEAMGDNGKYFLRALVECAQKTELWEHSPRYTAGYSDGPKAPQLTMSSVGTELLVSITSDMGFRPYVLDEAEMLKFSGTDCIDLLGHIYSGEYGPCSPTLRSQAEKFLYAGNQATFKLFRDGAVLPSKANASDSGFDVTLIGVEKEYGDVTLYRTGLRVKPPEGYYFDMVPRSSLHKKGHTLANVVGVIDQSYRGEILVALKRWEGFEPLELPMRAVQLIPRQVHPMRAVKGDAGASARGEGGFGSTGE